MVNNLANSLLNLSLSEDFHLAFGMFLKKFSGLLNGECALLWLLKKSDEDCTQNAAAQALGVSRARISTIVADLMDRGLIRRTPKEGDKRSYCLSLTSKGRATLKEKEAEANSLLSEMKGNLSEEEMRAGLKLLKRLVGCKEKEENVEVR